MSAPDSSDVTLALVDANVLACWESKVKLGLECSLLLKHSEGKITTTLQYSSSAFPPPLSQAEKVNKKEQRRKKIKRSAKKFEALLAYQKRLVEEKGLPPSRLMLQHAAVNTSSCSPVSEPDKEGFKCDECDFSSKSKRGLKTHITRTHKDTQKPEDLRSEEHQDSLNVSELSQQRESSLVNADSSTISSTPVKETVSDSVAEMCVFECAVCGQRCPSEEALRIHLRDKHGLPKKCSDCGKMHFCFISLATCYKAHMGIQSE